MTSTERDPRPHSGPDGEAKHSSVERWHGYEVDEERRPEAQSAAPTEVGGTPPRSIVQAIAPGRLLALVLSFILLGAAAGYFGALLWPKEYAARAEILYEISTEKPTGFLREDRSLTTQLVTLRSRQVLAPVAVTNGIPVEELQKQVTISLLDSSEVIQVEARAGNSDTALALTRGIVDRYRQIVLSEDGNGGADYLRDRLVDVRGELAAARTEAGIQRNQQAFGAVNASELASVEAKVQSLSDREQDLLAQLDEINIARIDAPRTEVVVAPYRVADPVSPRPLFAAASGALAASVVAALTLVVIVHRRSRTTEVG